MSAAEWLSERLQNSEGDYPWETVDWVYGLCYFAGIPAAYFALKGSVLEAAAGFALGTVFLVVLALVSWFVGTA